VPAPASLSIAAVLDQMEGLALPDPGKVLPDLRAALAQVEDLRARRGVRHRLTMVLSIAVGAVAAEARLFVAIAEWAADLPAAVADAIGVGGRVPSESTLRRVCSGWTPTTSMR
jgi:DDE_Tnp_1-associated